MNKTKQIKKYDRHVKMYENNLDNPTLNKWRKKVIHNAYGKVLEVGVGVGANFPYYNSDVHITGVDFSAEMIKSAKKAASTFQVQADFIQEDVNELAMENNSYDCIVSTLTLCSYPNPVETLNKFNNWCRYDGTILLMEHGLSSNVVLSLTQKAIDPLYMKLSGCHCNRDMQEIVGKSNLQINHIERHWADILYIIQASPSK